MLLLDEPTSAMDPASARLVRNAIKNIRSEDRAIIVCTHNLAEAEELADKIAIIRYGKIIANGTVPELKEQLLGPGEYKVQLAEPLDGRELPLPDGLVVTQNGLDWFSYRAPDAQETNPQILNKLVTAGYQVVKLEEVQRSLESVYLQAVNYVPVKEDPHVE